jgi:GT2 family glycosyltransferase
MPAPMNPAIAECLPAVARALDLPVSRLTLRQEIPPAGRRSSYSATRQRIEVDGEPVYSVKWYPPDYHRSVDDIIATSARLARDLGLRIPRFVAKVSIGETHGIIEEHLRDAPSLQLLRDKGELGPEAVIGILRPIFQRFVEHRFPAAGQIEKDRARCLQALRWIGTGTAVHRELERIIRETDVLFDSSACLIQEDLVPSNVLMAGSRKPVLIDFDHCHTTTMPWFAAWRAAHAGGLPRFFWRPDWDKAGPANLFALCGALEVELQFSALEPARFFVDRDQNWQSQLAEAQRTRDLAQAQAADHAAAIQHLSETSEHLLDQAKAAATARGEFVARLQELATHLGALDAHIGTIDSHQQASALHIKAIDSRLQIFDSRLTAFEAHTQAALSTLAESERATARRFDVLARSLLPSVSIIIVNYNGRRFLPGLFEALGKQDYPNIEVVFVDNASVDGSADFAASLRPSTVIVRSRENRGFADGNNLGVRHASGDYVVFLNNDTQPEPGWLSALVAAARSSPRIGAVGSKILFLTKFIRVGLSVIPFVPSREQGSADTRELGVAFDTCSGVLECDYRKPIFSAGFHGAETWEQRSVRWTAPEAVLHLPVPATGPATLRLIVRGAGAGDRRTLRVTLGGGRGVSVPLGDDFTSVDLALEAADLAGAVDIINNAGSYIDDQGNIGDRGIEKVDDGSFSREEIVSCLCGCSLLMRRDLFWHLGGFDGRFFMYCEDSDLCCRIRQAGFVLRYQPASVVRHIHAGSSTEWSPFFTFFVTRNSALIRLKHLPLAQAAACHRALVARWRRARAACHGRRPPFDIRTLNILSPAQIEYLALSQARWSGWWILAGRYGRRLLGRSRPRLLTPSHTGYAARQR